MSETEQNPLLNRFLGEKPSEVVDLGAGLGRHTGHMLQHGVRVTAVDRVLTGELRAVLEAFEGRGTFLSSDVTRLPFVGGSREAIWAPHCLEHLPNPLGALAEWRRVLRPGSLLGVVVRPFKTEVVGRHVFTGWTVGQLMLTLFRAGFEVRHGVYRRYKYNVFAIVRPAEDPPVLEPDDEILYRYHDRFAPAIEMEILRCRRQNAFGETIGCFEGDIERLGW